MDSCWRRLFAVCCFAVVFHNWHHFGIHLERARDETSAKEISVWKVLGFACVSVPHTLDHAEGSADTIVSMKLYIRPVDCEWFQKKTLVAF